MNSQESQELRSLQEVYLEVYASQEELDEGREGGRFEYNQTHGRPLIDPAYSQRRSETETLGGGTYQRGPKRLPKNKRKYDRQVLSGVRAASKQEKERARERMGIGENYDLYDIILSHLLDEGYAETTEAAEVIMVNMSEDWRESIVDEMLDEGKSSRPRYPGGRGVLDQERRDEKREASAENMRGHTAGPGSITKNPNKLRKQKAMGEHG